MYVRYLYKLHQLHLQAGNLTEAAFTLLLHGELLSWSEQLLPEENGLPMEHAWNRKERLYNQVIDLFDKGKVCLANSITSVIKCTVEPGKTGYPRHNTKCSV